ncbi:Nitrogen regulatory PII-like isoform 1 [Chlorella sorokiniana]|uniref:Nitrogen regulatory PII-like isoform 1 n=1 Tax=Chlorella sorokiniana TaxID=3076 RepID=A0A2P6U4P3_CHLSO|nr:Nitrogen regulatory PII-like isoform 1 [Chlorella sorokiniana]|eukprot:PRW61281.1 Nitrogen regulatory PII-like isoform 1 [Chlorella sorokiniana]
MAEPPAGWEATVDALEPLLPGGKPRLTAELLARPPFRFIFDCDKEAKLSYLTKLVEAIGSTLGQPVPARPSKIVAGLEPEATNAMLRMLAAAATGGAKRSGSAVSGAASRYAPPPPAGLAAHASDDSEAGQQAEAPSVAFQRVDNMLPALARQCGEARSALSAGAAPGSHDALALCEQVAGIARDAAVLARSLEQLLGAAPVIAAEAAAWRSEADKLAARLAEEEQGEARAAAASARRMADLDAQLAAARQRVALAAAQRYKASRMLRALGSRAALFQRSTLVAVRRQSAVQQQGTVMSAAAGGTGVSLVFVTVPSAEVGRKIANSLVENKLAACVNIIPGLVSIYSWQGKIESDAELLLKIKTRKQLLPELTEHVKGLHPYDECEVTAVDVTGGSPSYLAWVLDSTKAG